MSMKKKSARIDSQVHKILERQLERVEVVIRVLEQNGALEEIQRQMGQLGKDLLRPGADRTRAFVLFEGSMGSSLAKAGASEEQIAFLIRRFRENLSILIEQHGVVDVGEIMSRALQQWRRETARGNARRKTHKTRRMGYCRLAAAGGLFLIDSANAATIVPLPGFVMTSLLAGVTLFLDGVEKILE